MYSTLGMTRSRFFFAAGDVVCSRAFDIFIIQAMSFTLKALCYDAVDMIPFPIAASMCFVCMWKKSYLVTPSLCRWSARRMRHGATVWIFHHLCECVCVCGFNVLTLAFANGAGAQHLTRTHTHTQYKLRRERATWSDRRLKKRVLVYVHCWHA